MPTKRISMRKLKEIMRLKFDAKLSNRQIARSLNISASTVSRYLGAINVAGFNWPLSSDVTEEKLESQVFTRTSDNKKLNNIMPDLIYIEQELKKKNVTKQLLWEEYVNKNPNHYYSYSQFCNLYRNWRKENNVSMRQIHYAGEKLFVDYSGHTIPIYNKNDVIINQAQIFIAVLGASNYTFAFATPSQSLENWLGAHVRAFEYFGGVPQIVVPDNLKSGVTKACKYDPDINPSYNQMAQYYNVAIIPARPYKPKDKAKAEVAVQIVQRWILARLRNEKFYSLTELNAVIKNLLVDLNNKNFKKRPGSRLSNFIATDKEALQPLPSTRYEFTKIKKVSVPMDYHIEVNNAYYSVPYHLAKKKVEVYITCNTVSIYYKGQRVASHAKIEQKGEHITTLEHMPINHQKCHEWSMSKFTDLASKIGPATYEIIKYVLQEKLHPAQAYRSCSSILSLEKKYSTTRLENACKRAILIGSKNRRSINSILKTGLDQIQIIECNSSIANLQHENIRGSSYYN